MAPVSSRKPIYGIDLVRFCAALAVVLYHFSAKPFLDGSRSTVGRLVGQVWAGPAGDEWGGPPWAVWWGWIGVQVFFVVSGAVIAFSVAHAAGGGAGGGRGGEHGVGAGNLAWRRFAVGRLSRLWPAMLPCVALIAVLNLGWWGHRPFAEGWRVIGSLAFLPWGPWVSGQFWTLPIEVIFYGLVAVLIAARGIGRRGLEMLAGVLGCWSAGFWLLAAAGMVHPGSLAMWTLAWHGVYFALGATAMAVGSGGWTLRRAALVAVCCLGAWFEVGAATHKELGADATAGAAGRIVPYVLWLMVVGFVFWATIRRDAVASRVEALPGAARTLRAIGLATYPLYMIHVQPGALVMAYALWHGASLGVAVTLACAVALVLALLVALVVEPRLTARVRYGLEELFGVPRGSRGRAPEPAVFAPAPSVAAATGEFDSGPRLG